jgi:membrane-associated phospholipid phosphatase
LTIAQDWPKRRLPQWRGDRVDREQPPQRTRAARILAWPISLARRLEPYFDAKFAYYLIRPSQADPQIKLPVGLPNHPSYPSGHSCITAAYATVLASLFPEESAALNAMIDEAGLSRMYAGLHYRFDCVVGQELGRRVAEYVLRSTGNSRSAIPLD